MILRYTACMRVLPVAVILLAVVAGAQLYPPFPRFAVHPGRADGDGEPASGAALCVVPAGAPCYVLPPHTAKDDSKVTYQFGLAPRAEREELLDGGALVFFSGTFSAGGSGSLDELAILSFDAKKQTLTNLLPYVALTNVSDRAMWKLPDASPYPVLVTADFIWNFDQGETHFDPHRFTVEAWRMNFTSGHYEQVVKYTTAKKYDSGDSAPVRVLAPERAEIVRRLAVVR